jgi:glycerophosphoryl diester phosphodiesterase
MPNLEPLRQPVIGFAHRGARAHAPENTLEAFALALRLGAKGLESDVWLTADGVPVLDHDGIVGGRVRRRSIGGEQRADLPAHVPTLAELYETCGTAYELSLDVKDERAVDEVVAVARRAGDGAAGRLWLCGSLRMTRAWRPRFEDVKLVDSTRLRALRDGPERRAAELADAGIDAINLHHTDWSAGLATLFHRFGVLAFGWDAQHERVLDGLLAMGIDGVYSDHVDRMIDAFARREVTGR